MSFRTTARRARVLALTMASVVTLAGCAGEPAAPPPPPPPPAVVVSAVTPDQGGLTTPGTVTITGKHLDRVASVDFGDADATVKSSTATSITVAPPAAEDYQPAQLPISLLAGDDTVLKRLPDAYNYTAASPVDKQLQYALAHWDDYNTKEYGDLNPVGGDCANFVSQTLIARGWTMNDEWYNHDAAADWSAAWGYVPAMEDYFEANQKALGITRLGLDDRSQVAVGDVVIFDWNDNDSADHVMLVSKKVASKDGTITIEMVGHNDDYDYRDLDVTLAKYPDAGVVFWHLGS